MCSLPEGLAPDVATKTHWFVHSEVGFWGQRSAWGLIAHLETLGSGSVLDFDERLRGKRSRTDNEHPE